MKFEDMLNTITLGDSYELIRDIPDNSIDLIITDPPYEYTTGGGAGCFGTRKRSYHNEYYKVSINTNLLQKNKEYKNEGQKRVWEDKKKSREEIKHISSGFNYELLNELDRVMKKINIYIYGVVNTK